jgi:hypothetical protein
LFRILFDLSRFDATGIRAEPPERWLEADR